MINEIKNIATLMKLGRATAKLNSSSGEQQEVVAATVAKMLSENAGFLLKVGQYLGSSPEAHSHLANLASSASLKPLDVKIIKAEIEAEYKIKSECLFAEISERGKIASVSQVHRVVSKSGQVMALKVKLPGIEENLSGWMKTLKLIPGIGPVKKWDIEFQELKAKLSELLLNELNFQDEMRKINVVKRLTSEISWLASPAAYEIYCTHNVLGMEWMLGAGFSEVVLKSKEVRAVHAERLIRFFIKSLFVWNFVQTDPNPGNFLFSDEKLILLDAASFNKINREVGIGLLRLVTDRSADDEELLNTLSRIGFDREKLGQIREQLPKLIDLLTEPLRSNSYNIGHWNVKQRMEALLAEKKWWFRSAGPAEFFPIMRAIGLFSRIIGTLDCDLDWNHILCEELSLVEGPTIKIQKAPFSSERGVSAPKKFLDIRVRSECGEDVASVKLPIHEDTKIEELIPDDVLQKLEKDGISFENQNLKIQSNIDLPFELFKYESENRRVSINIVA